MRILLVTGTTPPSPCGVGDYTEKLASSLAVNGVHDIAILSGGKENSSASPSNVQRLAGPMNWHLHEFGTIWNIINIFKADVVHLQMPSQAFKHRRLPDLIPAIAWGAGAAVVRTWHESPGVRALLPLALQAVVPGENIVVRQDFLSGMPASLRRVVKHGCAFIPSASAIPRVILATGERDKLRQHYMTRNGRLIVFFGFLYPAKGAELVFEIADSTRDTLILAGPVDESDPYTRMILGLCQNGSWAGHAISIGMLKPDEAAKLLAAADAVVLPFTSGGGSWNTSIFAAVQQGTPVITTSSIRRGLDRAAMVDYSQPGDLVAMRIALDSLACQRRNFSPRFDRDEWQVVSRRHMTVYRRAVSKRTGR